MVRKWQTVLVFLLGVATGVLCAHLTDNLLSQHSNGEATGGVQLLRQHNPNDQPAEQANTLSIDTLDKAIVWTPRFSHIDLVCGESPSEGDGNIVLAAEAAFTGKEHLDGGFAHSHIAGNHVSGGTYRQGYDCADNSGAFVWTKDGWQFVQRNTNAAMAVAADHQGAAFAQVLFIHQGKRVHCNIAATQVFRSLCKREGQLCIIESRTAMRFYDYVLYLLAHNVEEALYLDSGKAFAHTDNGSLVRLTQNGQSHGTNWLTFYR